MATSGSHFPPEVVEVSHKMGFGKGWALSCGCSPEIRQLSPETKGKMRRKNPERRIEKAAPLFKEQLIQLELEKNCFSIMVAPRDIEETYPCTT
jgi:hypothetical protein